MSTKSAALAIPGTLNVVLGIVACVAAGALLWFASHTDELWAIVLAAIAFSYVANTIFSLLHEAVHGAFFRSRLFQTVICRWYGFEPMVADLARVPGQRMRLEIVFTVVLQAALVVVLDLTLLGWCACYMAFALNWCSLQYTDHAWTRRDIVNGASNLRVNRAVQWIFLNYHHHLAHHQHPEVSWIHLPRFVDFDRPRPSFLKTYLSLWLGPKPTHEPSPQPLDARVEPWLRV